MKNKKLLSITEGAIMVSLATALSFIRIVKFPWGGAITLLSMLPIIVYAVRYGIVRGFAVSFVYSMIQLGQGILFDGLFGWGLTPVSLISCIILDYILAFSLICLAGAFGNKRVGSLICGVVLAMLLRFGMHYLSGVFIFGSFGELWAGFSTDNKWLYSLLYNGAYMLPETVFTTIGAIALFKTPQIRRILFWNDGV